MKHIGLFLCFLTLSISVWAQQGTVASQSNWFGIDTSNHIIVVHQSKADSLIPSKESFKLGDETFKLIKRHNSWSPTEAYPVLKEQDTFTLYVTALPIIKLTAVDSIVDEPKRAADFSYVDRSTNFNAAVGIEWRGNSALKYPKKSYDMELRKDKLSEESIDFKFDSLREDDDWIFNSLYNEPLKLRSYFSTKLWLEIQQLSYAEKEPEAKSFTDVIYAEVFLNDTYQGVYLFAEQLDRKQLQLKKIKGDTVRGELFKAGSYKDGTAFKSAPKFNNAFPHWAGFEVEYPYENYEAHWDNLHDFVGFVANSSDTEFKNEIESYIDIDNAIDYFLFINLLRGTDNLSKNYFLAKYKEGEPYFFIPWDLDGVLGTIQDGKRIPTTNDVLTNNFFDRLKQTNAGDYRVRLKQRWQELRAGAFSDTQLFDRLDTTYEKMVTEKIYERDAAVWGRTETVTADYEYLRDWLSKRTAYLDSVFNEF